ncbi:MAG: T9SS type A sorting domain-containing protein [Bacteroidales bacterium]|nr:T9SS type A sorting domain-containing protein [Bacteroidales bacterium]
MKRVILLTIVVIFGLASGISQSCLPEGISFSTQAQIDGFHIDYPGCTQIEGDVTISGSDIENLDGLNVLISVNGNLKIKSNIILSELSGLQNLEYLGGDLRIEQNNVLENLQGLNNLVNINGDLIIGDIELGPYPYSTGNPLLTSLTGLNNLASIEGSLKLCGNYSLTSLSGLENLTYISENLQVGGIEFVYGFTFGNPLLLNLQGLTRLSAIGGGLFIAGNSNLANLSGLDSLTSVSQNCWFDWNESLATLQGINQLGSIGGSLFIRWNNALKNISSLENIATHSIQDLEIRYNDSLAECNIKSICEYLASPGAVVTIDYNANGCNSPDEVEEACESMGLKPLLYNWHLAVGFFPNPFCNSITMEYELVKCARTHLIVYDFLGKEMATLVNGLQPKGQHLLQWDATNLPEGIYFYHLQVEDQILTGKLVKFQAMH